jgi:cytochrome c553
VTGILIALTSCSPKPTIKVPAEFESGQNNFHRVCANCHGVDALGKQTRAPGLIDPEYLSENFSDEEMYKQIIEGSDKMRPQRNKLSDPEVAEIIKYIRYSQKAADLVVGEDESDEDEDQ